MANNEIVHATTDVELTTSTVLDLLTNPTTNWSKLSFRVSNPDETAARIAQRELSAASIDELLGGGETISGKDYIGKPFCVNSVDWQASDIVGEGLPFYAVIHAADINGESLTITTGARTVVRKLAIMAGNGWLPAWVKIVKGPKTDAGYEPLDLAKAEAPELPFD